MAVIACLGALAGCGTPTGVAPGYPRQYRQLIDAAAAERQLLIWSATDKAKAAPLVAAFERTYPAISVTYVELPAASMNARYLTVAGHAATSPDILWSSAMDLQIKLSNDGHAQSYASPEADRLPRWANWKNQAWGTTAEPIVLLYNRRLVAADAVPMDHAGLIRLLEADRGRCRYRVAGYDVPNSAVGYLYLSQDAQASADIWRLVDAMHGCGARFYLHAEDMLRAVQRGDAAFAYDIVGSYALEQTRHDPDLGIVLMRDYTLLMSRIALITASAPHPSAARLFIDFLLSPTGQRYLVEESMPAVRDDVPGPPALVRRDVPLRAIRVGPGLLATQDQLTRRGFLRRWQRQAAVPAR